MLNACTDPVVDETQLDDVEEELAELSAHIDAATHRQLTLIGIIDAAGRWHAQGATSCAHWLSWRIGLDLGAARERVRIARALPSLPGIDAAFRSGALSYSKVRAMARVGTPDNEARLLELARSSTAAQLEKICRGIRSAERGRPTNAPERWVTQTYRDDGTVRVVAQLLPDEAERVMEAIRAVRASMAAGAEEAAPQLADALVRLADTALAETEPQASRTHGADRAQVVVHLAPGVLDEGYETQLENGARVSAEAFQRMACDCSLLAVREDGAGNVLDIGRKSRTIPPALRRAVMLRDQHRCAFPGCTHDRFVDLHHIEHWIHGGETKLDNLLSLCTFHHGLVHEHGWRVQLVDGAARFHRPEGMQIPIVPPLEMLDHDPIEALLASQHELDIDDETGLTAWDGRPIDYAACASACCVDDALSLSEWIVGHPQLLAADG